MKLKTFIERPVLSIVISVAIVLLGCIALVTLPVEQFPSIVPPTVEVMTSYPGANAETVQKSVIVPLKEAINGVENMTYIHSTASNAGDAIQAIREVAAESLPRGYGFKFAGISREESQTTNNTGVIFLICTVFVYLILCGLYESFFVPFAVILAVPFGLMGSFLFAKLMGLENNIYMQTGLIMLIGLLAKTAILLTEYAADRRRAGMSLVQAALAAARVRFRPILMTVLAMIFGLLPLMFASGAGANGNSSLGSGVVGGMVFGILAILFLVPVFFVMFQYIQERVKPVEFLPHPDWEIQSEMEDIRKRKEEKVKKNDK